LEEILNTHESRYIKELEGNSIDALNALIEEHGLKQSDLSEIGRQAGRQLYQKFYPVNAS